MIPSNRWFPAALQDRAAWFANFNAQIQTMGVGFGLSNTDLTKIENDNFVMQFLAGATVTLDAYADAIRQYRIIITEGDIGDTTPEFPPDISLALPTVIPTGIFERLDGFVKRIRAAPAFTMEAGAALGINPSTPTPTPPSELKPVITASESFGGFAFSVNVTRLGMPAFKVQIQRQGATAWQDAAFATNNPCEVTVTPTTPGQSERIMVRAVLMKSNEPVGIPSDPTYVTVNP